MAEEVTRFVHGEEEYQKAIETTQKLFAQSNAPADALSVEDLESMEGIVRLNLERSRLDSGIDVITFLTETAILPSKGEARKMIQNGGISINRNKVEEVQMIVDSSLLLHNHYLLVQKGKKNYYLVKSM